MPNTSATAASSGADLNGGAVKNACEQIKERLLQVAATSLGISPADVRIEDGEAHGVAYTSARIPWDELVKTGLLPPGPAVRRRVLPHRGPALGLAAVPG